MAPAGAAALHSNPPPPPAPDAMNTPTDPTAARWLETVLDAHGGAARWAAVERLDFRLSSGGLAFASKFQGSALKGLAVALWPHAMRVELRDFSAPGWCGVWTPERVWLQDTAGRTVDERTLPRAAFATLRRQLAWDRLDILYFAGYALWNYLSFPWLLTAPGVTLTGVEPAGRQGAQRLQARFDAGVPTHSAEQAFVVDAAGRLLRHDYTADVIGPWATAANRCLDATVVDGLRWYTRRRVTPRFGADTVLPGPTLVWIAIEGLRVVRRGEF